MRHLLFVLIALMSGSALDALPAPLQILGPVQQVPPQCSDPTYACQDLENARKCGVVKSCINDVWANMNAPDDNEDICSLCKEMVKEARDQLLSNMTQEELKEVFEGSCRLLPIQLIADGCIKLVDEFIPDLVEMLASRMDPNMVCTVAGLCNLAHLPIQEHFRNLLNLAAVSVNTDTKCEECTAIMTEVKSFVSQMSEPDFQQMIIKLCEAEVIAPICTTLIQTYASQIYQFIVTSDPKSVCSAANICPAGKGVVRVPLENKGVGDDLVCQFCTNVLEHVKEMITANTTVDEFRTALLNFCTHLGSFSKECTSFVDDYFDMIYDYIRKLDTKGVCTLAGLCQSGMHRVYVSPLVKLFPAETQSKHAKMVRLTPSVPIAAKFYSQPMVKLVPAKQMTKKGFKNTADIETNNIFDSVSKSQLPIERLGLVSMNLNRDLDCPFCKAVSFFLKQDLKDERTLDGVRMAMHGVCDKWVKEFPNECKLFLEKYSAQVENHVVVNGDFDSLCININACPLVEKETGVNVRVISPTSTPAPAEDICDLCKKVFDEAESLVKNPDIQKSIKNFVEQLCQICPAKQKCINVIDQNIDKLLAIIEKNLQSGVACPALHLCPATRVSFSPSVKNVECDLCKNLVQELVNELQDPQTKSTVQSILEKGCGLLPQELSAQCKTFVDKNVDGIIQMLINTLNPDMVCATLNICPDSRKVVKPPKRNDLECELCKEVVQKVEDQIKDQKTEEAIKEALERVCSYFPSSMLDKCKSFVDTYTETLITLLLQEMDPSSICAALNICPESKKVVVTPKSNDLECDLCKEVIQNVEDQLKDQKTEEAIREALEKVCSYLPSSMTDKCKSFVDTYTDMLISLILQEMDPAQICAALKMCPESKKVIVTPKGNDLECDLCKEVIQNVEDQLKDQKTEEAIREALEKVCGYLPSSMTDKCKSFVDTYTDMLISLILQEMDPAQICAALKMCPESVNKVKPPKNDVECDLCKEVVQMVESELKDKRTEDAIRNALDKVCSLLPSSLSSRCQTFVNTYLELLVTLLVEEMDPTMVCAALNVCPTQDVECESCQYLFHYIQEQLATTSTQEELKNMLKRLCDILPQTYADNCDAFVDEYGASLFMLVAQELDPSVMCPRLGMCPSGKHYISRTTQPANVKSAAIDKCELCTTVVDYIDKYLEDDDVDKEITQLVEKVCNIMPASVKDKCSAVIETYGPYILQMIGEIADSKQVCQDIDLCSRPPGHVHLVGAKKCTFGPSYWCSSKAHAVACKAETFCKEKVWKN